MTDVNEVRSDVTGAGAPESEIEITSEMIEAGAAILDCYDRIEIGPATAYLLAAEIIEAAMSANRNRTA